jgi:hypothetical protein
MEEYLSPEDKAALIDFAGPLFAQAKFIDANSVDKDGYQTSRQAHEIQSALERDFQRSTPARPPQHYLPPQNVIDYGQQQHVPYPTHIPAAPQPYYPPTPVDNGQLEFKFDESAQQKTNSLLEDISRKLTKLISLLEPKTKPTENVTKLKVTKDPVQEIPRGAGKNQ